MYMVIGILTYSKSKEEAIEQARRVLDDSLCGDDKPFDYYALFTPDENSSLSGANRWGKKESAMRVDSGEGKKFTEKLLEYTRQELFENIEKIKNGLSQLNADDLWHNEDKRVADAEGKEVEPIEIESTMLRYFCHEAGEYRGPSIFLYDHDGEGIRDIKHYQNVLSKWDSLYPVDNPYRDMDIWVVPVDVHY